MELVDQLEEVKCLDLDTFDCFILSVSSHGDEGTPGKRSRGVFMTSDRKFIPVNYILSNFSDKSCPKLIGKPKIFIFPICRGVRTEGTDVGRVPPVIFQSTEKYEEPSNEELYTLHDTKVLFATKMGFKAFSNPQVGRWFVFSLCEALANHAHDLDFNSIVTEAEFLYSTWSGDSSRKSCSENFAFQKYLYLNPGLQYIP
ncbi:hypothetical protein HA402_011619 [Bradysia odoriphaga]|nr:hypothetical protein HA402_011619 [Bradysia odoriphaga]